MAIPEWVWRFGFNAVSPLLEGRVDLDLPARGYSDSGIA